MNVAQGGTLIQDLPTALGHEHHCRVPGSFDGADHPVHLAAGSRAAAAAGGEHAGTLSHHHQGVDRLGEDLVVSGWSDLDELPGGDRGARPPLRARRPVASGGRRDQPRDRHARRGGAGVRARAGSLRAIRATGTSGARHNDCCNHHRAPLFARSRCGHAGHAHRPAFWRFHLPDFQHRPAGLFLVFARSFLPTGSEARRTQARRPWRTRRG